MKIILVTHSFFPYSIGGREKYVYSLAKTLSEVGHEVRVFTCSDSLFKSYYKIEKPNFSIHYFPTIRISLPMGCYRVPLAMYTKLRKIDADVIHAHDFHHFTTLISSIVSKKTKIPLVVTEHGYPEQFGMTKFVIKHYDNLVLPFIARVSSKIIAVSNFIKKELIQKYSIPEKKIRVIYNGIRLKDYKKKSLMFRKRYELENKKIILSVGRLTKEKGFQYLIKAFFHVEKNIPEIVLCIVGPRNYYENNLKKLARIMGISNKVIFTGTISEEMLKSALFSSNLVVIPSLYEPFGIVALEAMVYGKPIIASAVGGLVEVLENNRNSLLVPPANVKALTDKMLTLLLDKRLANKIGRNGKRDVRKYEWKNIVDKVVDIYQN